MSKRARTLKDDFTHVGITALHDDEQHNPSDPPAWSVLIPAYNRPARLQACLEAIAKIEAPAGGFEVIVVDDGSSPALSEQLAVPTGLDARIVRQDNAGPASARNRAAKEARGQWLAFTDDDCRPHSRWLVEFEASLQGDRNTLVGGHTINELTNCAPAAASQLLLNYLHEYFNERQGSPTFFPSNNVCLSREAFESLNGFDVSFPLAAAEDRDFCDRAVQAGLRMIFAPEASIDHAHAMSARGFWRQHYNYGRGAYAYHRLRSDRLQDRIRIEPRKFYFDLIRYPLRRNWSITNLIQCMYLFVSQVANIAGYVREKIASRFSNTSQTTSRD